MARLTGESMTEAVTEVVRERLERKQREHDQGKWLPKRWRSLGVWPAIGAGDRCAHGRFLYDERGLPR